MEIANRFELVATARREIGTCGHSHETRSEAARCPWSPPDDDPTTEIVVRALPLSAPLANVLAYAESLWGNHRPLYATPDAIVLGMSGARDAGPAYALIGRDAAEAGAPW